MGTRIWVLGSAAFFAAGIALGKRFERETFASMPVAKPGLVFSGVLTDSQGNAVNDGQDVEVRVWESEAGGNAPKCTIAASIAPRAGAFQIGLGSCENEISSLSPPWLEFFLKKSGVSLGRLQASAVPYALRADLALEGGSIDSRLANIERFADCPRRYVQDTGVSSFVLCKKKLDNKDNNDKKEIFDEVVRVGQGASAFWVDRYEASLWSTNSTSAVQYGFDKDDLPATFPDNGQWTIPMFAVSRRDVLPSRFLTWFQANEACRASGKLLLSGDEWLTAAKGTPDDAWKCYVSGSTDGPRTTGQGAECRSYWGAEDMIGNIFEFTNEWFAGPETQEGDAGPTKYAPWGNGFQNDAVWNIASSASTKFGVFVKGIPAAAVRGGDWTSGDGAGIFALHVEWSPAGSDKWMGFRCALPW